MRLSIKEVVKTLFEALLLVIVVMYVFLQSVRASAIATSAIVISITGTFAGMLVLGFSLNLLTLFGLVLAIGLVVDDAIVVIENATRNIKEPPRSAGSRAQSHGRGDGPVVATVLVLTGRCSCRRPSSAGQQAASASSSPSPSLSRWRSSGSWR